MQNSLYKSAKISYEECVKSYILSNNRIKIVLNQGFLFDKNKQSMTYGFFSFPYSLSDDKTELYHYLSDFENFLAKDLLNTFLLNIHYLLE